MENGPGVHRMVWVCTGNKMHFGYFWLGTANGKMNLGEVTHNNLSGEESVA